MLLSTTKFATAGYVTVFDGEEVNIYDASNTEVIITREAILRGWFDKTANLWCTHSYLSSKTPTPTPSLSKSHQQSSFLTAYHPPRPCTMSMS
jgi:hypothetical protein